LEPHYAWIAAGIAVVILYGSFYPFAFYLHHDPRGPVGVLLASGFEIASRDDFVANVLLYLPIGFFAVYVIQRRTLTAIVAATTAGLALSLLVELVQFYDRGRFQELSDVYSNTMGALLGATAGAVARRRAPSAYLALILACWLGARWSPAVPLAPTVRAGSFLLVGSVLPLDLFRYFAAWLAVGLMTETLLGQRRSRIALPWLLAGSLLVRALAVEIETAELVGGAAAALLWSGLLWRLRSRTVIAAALFVALLVWVALEPFHFSNTARAFGWVPFRSFLEAPTDTAIRSFFEKAFLYGGMVWLLVRAGLSTGAATGFGATLVFCLRLIQVYLPGRSAEITDTLLFLMLATMMQLVSLAHHPPVKSEPA
jgi:VanZ family protein